MVAAAATRARTPAANQPVAPAVNTPRRSAGTWVIIGVPVLLVLTFVWQIGSGFMHTEIAVRQAISVGRVSLEADPAGSRIDFVVVDRVGQETTVNGTVNVKLREPDGTLWQTSRTVSGDDFKPLPDGSLLAGRPGMSVIIPAADWVRPPRRGGSATVSIDVQPSDDGPAFSTVAEERFP
jgi:hypothetical protein